MARLSWFRKGNTFSVPAMRFRGEKAIADIKARNADVVSEYIAYLQGQGVALELGKLEASQDSKDGTPLTPLGEQRLAYLKERARYLNEMVTHSGENIMLRINPVLKEIILEQVYQTLSIVDCGVTREYVEEHLDLNAKETQEFIDEVEMKNGYRDKIAERVKSDPDLPSKKKSRSREGT